MRPTTYRAGRNGMDGRTLRDPGGPGLHGGHQRGPALQRAAEGRPGLRGGAARSLSARLRGRAAAGRRPHPRGPDLRGHRSAAAEGAGATLRRPAPDPLARRPEAPGVAAGMAAAVLHAAPGDAVLRLPAQGARRALLQRDLPLQRAAARRQPLQPRRRQRADGSRPPCAACSSTSRRGWAPWAGRTPSSPAAGRPHERADGHAAPAAPSGRQRAAPPPAGPRARRRRPRRGLPHVRAGGRPRGHRLRAPPDGRGSGPRACPRRWRRPRPGGRAAPWWSAPTSCTSTPAPG